MTLPIVTDDMALPDLARAMRQLVDHLRKNEILLNSDGWAGGVSNLTPDRGYDADSTSTAELADVLGTLIQDLVDSGIIK